VLLLLLLLLRSKCCCCCCCCSCGASAAAAAAAALAEQVLLLLLAAAATNGIWARQASLHFVSSLHFRFISLGGHLFISVSISFPSLQCLFISGDKFSKLKIKTEKKLKKN
jgi:hypothetical protein